MIFNIIESINDHQLLVPMMVPRECMRDDGSILYDSFLEDLESRGVPDNVSVDGTGLHDENEVRTYEIVCTYMAD